MRFLWFFLLAMGLVGMIWAESVESAGIRLGWRVEGSEVIFTLDAPTTGWVAIGWGATQQMRDADFIIGYVTNGSNGVIEDHFGVSTIGHRRDTDLGGKENVRLIEAKETNNRTILVFARQLVSKEAYDVNLVLDKPFEVILAYGRFDNTSSKHAVVTKVKIVLKREP